MSSKSKNHRCEKHDINWNRDVSNVGVEDECVRWYGKCSQCGRRVYELYCQMDELYDAATDEDIHDVAEEE